MLSGDRRSLLGPRYRPQLDALEDRSLPTSFLTTPVVPTIDGDMAAHLSTVLQRGFAGGNLPNVFARAGDSITYSTSFLLPLARPSVGTDLTGDGSLNDTLGYFRHGGIGNHNSFSTASRAARGGWTSFDVLANLPKELAANRPAFVFIMVGTNDSILGVPLDTYRQNVTAIVSTAVAAGVVPVLSTVPDNLLLPAAQERQPGYNQVIEDVGEALRVPVWNYWRALQQLPYLGISVDGIHPSVSPNGANDLSEGGLEFGYNVRNLTALQTLDKLRRILLLGQPADVPSRSAGWVPLTHAVAVAAGDASGFQVQLIDAYTRQSLAGLDPFSGFPGSVRVALGDVNGDRVPDLIATTGPGGAPHVKVFDGQTGALRASFYAFEPGLTTGLSVATGDVNGDGVADILVAPESAGRAHVKVFTGSGELLRSFVAFDDSFVGGARVASTDVNGDGFADIVVTAGTGGRGHTAVYSGATGALLASFLPFGADFGGLVSVAAGDFGGTGQGEVAVGVAAGDAPHVVVFRPSSGGLVGSFYAYDTGFRGGMRLAPVIRGGRTDLLTVPYTAGMADVRQFDAVSGTLEDRFVLYEVGFRHGAVFGG